MPNEHVSRAPLDRPQVYQIRLTGHLDSRWMAWFGDATITLEDTGDTLLVCTVADQAALHGLLKRVRDLGIPLSLVKRLELQQSDSDEQKHSRWKGFMNSRRLSALLIGALFVISTCAFLTKKRFSAQTRKENDESNCVYRVWAA